MGRARRVFTVKETLERFLEKHRELGFRIKSQAALSTWGEVVDDYVRGHSAAVLVKDGTLFVNTDSAALANELHLGERELRQKINERLRMPVIQQIVFKSGLVKSKNKIKTIKNIKSKNITLGTLNRIDDAVQTVQNDELRFTLRKLLISAAMRNTSENGKDSN